MSKLCYKNVAPIAVWKINATLIMLSSIWIAHLDY